MTSSSIKETDDPRLRVEANLGSNWNEDDFFVVGRITTPGWVYFGEMTYDGLRSGHGVWRSEAGQVTAIAYCIFLKPVVNTILVLQRRVEGRYLPWERRDAVCRRAAVPWVLAVWEARR